VFSLDLKVERERERERELQFNTAGVRATARVVRLDEISLVGLLAATNGFGDYGCISDSFLNDLMASRNIGDVNFVYFSYFVTNNLAT